MPPLWRGHLAYGAPNPYYPAQESQGVIMDKALLIVDPQCDFINGSLAVPSAVQKMNALADHLKAACYDLVLVTYDAHPWDHCSFDINGGQWPIHCRVTTPGAAIWPPLAKALSKVNVPVHTFPKGTDTRRDEYSIWQNEKEADILDSLLSRYKPDRIEICGIAGDICVLQTLKDGVNRYGSKKFVALTQFSPSLDGGAALANFCRAEGICIR